MTTIAEKLAAANKKNSKTEETSKNEEKAPVEKFLFKSHDFTHETSGKTIRIYGMRHVAFAKDYAIVNSVIAQDYESGFTVHVEGVKEAPEAMDTLRDFYAALAEHFSMAVQKYEGYPFEIHDATWAQMPFLSRKMLTGFLKLLEFSLEKLTIDEIFKGGIDEFETALQSKTLVGRIMTLMLGGPREEIAMNAALAVDGDVAMVWGAAHVESFAARLKRVGYVPSGSVILI